MTRTGTPERWSFASIALHWASALVILALIGIGWAMLRLFDAATRFATAACGVRSGVGPHAAIINVVAVSQALLDPVFIGTL